MRVAAVLLVPTLCMSAMAQAWLANGDFEEVQNDACVNWQVRSAGAATVGPDRVRGKWYHFVCDVKTGRFDKIHLYLSLADGVGAAWWDNFTSDALAIVNPSFEDVDSDGRLLGWRQDNVGVTIFSDSERTTHGARSLRLAHDDPERPLSRIRQVIEVAKNTDYRFEFDLFLSDDCTARPNVATLTYESDGKYSGSPMWIRTASWSDIRTERAGHGEYVMAMQLDGGEAEISQLVAIPVDRNAEVSAEIKTKDLDGELRLIVEDVDSGEVLGESTVAQENAQWHPTMARFQSRGTAGVRLRLVGKGTGQVRLDHAAVVEGAELVPPAQHVNWLPASENYKLPKTLRVYVEGAAGKIVEEGALAILAKDLALFDIELDRARNAAGSHLQIKIGDGLGVKDRGGESYSLVVSPLRMWATAQTPEGALYAIATLVQLLHRFPGQGPVALTCEISDWPDMPVRGAFWSHGFQYEQFARYKFNALYHSSSYWLDWIHEPQNAQQCQGPLDEAEKYGLEIYASMAVFQGNWAYRFHDPHLTEGKFVEGEKLTLRGTEPVPLRHALVIHTDRRGLTVKSEDGETVYEPEVDYRVVPGTPLSYPFTKLVDADPDAIARVEGGAIADGAAVIATYNYAEPSNKSELCMSEPDATRLIAEAVATTFERFPRLRYFNLNLDEIQYFNNCGLCRSDARSAERKLGDWIEAINAAMHAVQPEARLFTWDDMLSPHDRAYQMGFKDFRKAMPRDVIAFTWGYQPVTPQKTGWPTVKWWSEAGVNTVLIPWYDERNIRGWAQVFAEARRRGWPCLGMIDSFWHSRANYRETAICAWRVPREGERRYLALDFAD